MLPTYTPADADRALCRECDDRGRRPDLTLCEHTEVVARRARRGAARCAALIRPTRTSAKV